MNSKYSFLFAACFAGTAACLALPLEIAVRGRAPEYTVVTRDGASASEKYAAEELQGFLEKVTGVRLPVVDESEWQKRAAPGKAIFLGATKAGGKMLGGNLKSLGDDGFRIAARPPHLVAYGSAKRGALYAAYEILETYAGCKWYSSWHSRIPKRDVVAVPDDLDDTQKPAFVMRESFWYDVNTHRDLAARLRVNGYNHTYAPVDAKYGGDDFRFGGGLPSCHTFNTLMPPHEFFDKHPEYYSLVGGKRRLKDNSQLCLTNPDVLRIVTERVLERIRKDPTAKFYGVSQNDWGNYCQCEKCAAIDKEEGSPAGTIVRFVNAIAETVEKEFPNAIIETLAYHYSRRPPKTTRLRHNVMPCLCTIECDFARSMLESPNAENISFRNDIIGWTKQTDKLYLWDYTTEFHSFPLPFPDIYAMQDNIRFYRDNNVKYLFEQGDQCGRHGEFAELKAWLLAKWMWNPELPIKPLLDDFFEGYYGKAAPFIREYMEEEHRRQRAWGANPNNSLRISRGAAFRSLGDDFVEWAKPLWEKATAAVKDDPAFSYNVRMSEFSFDFLRLEKKRTKLLCEKALTFVPSLGDAANAEEKQVAALARKMLDRMAEAKDIRLSESGAHHNELAAAWKRLADGKVLKRRPVDCSQSQRGEIEESSIQIVEPRFGARVDDSKAGDGKATKMYNTHFEWCLQFKMDKVVFKPGKRYRLRARVRVDKAGPNGEVFWAGIYDSSTPKEHGRVNVQSASAKDGEYEWYDVCEWTPSKEGFEFFWIGPGRFGNDGKSCVKAVYLDKIEISAASRD